MISGVATAFALNCNMFGKLNADWAVLEIDEAYARRVFEHIKPNYIIVTNLFRDQLDRYGEVEITMDLIKQAIDMADGAKLILNGDDPVSSQLGDGKDAKYFGISEQVLPQTDEIKENRFCLKCGAEQKYNYYHYSQLGDYYCPNCSNKRPHIDFEATGVNLSGSIRFLVNKKDEIDVNYRGFYNIYNILAVYSLLSLMGENVSDFNAVLSDYKPQIGRMELIELNKPVILNLAKNPAGFNQAIQTVMLDKRKKDVIIAVNDAVSDGRDITWLWDVDFDKLNDENLNRLITSGVRLYDLALRFKYDDISVNATESDIRKAIEACLSSDAEVCYMLVNYTALFSTQDTLLSIKKGIESGGQKNEQRN